jgi:hypothetical protein
MGTASWTTLEKYDYTCGAYFPHRDFATVQEACEYARDRTVFYADDDAYPLRYRIVSTIEVTV